MLTLSPRNLADIYQDIRLIASVVALRPRARHWSPRCRRRSRKCDGAHASSDVRPRVYCEEWGKPLIHSQLWVRELVEAAGGVFLGRTGRDDRGRSGGRRRSRRNRSRVVWSRKPRAPRAIVQQRSWQDLRAVRGGRVYCIADELLNTPAPTLIGGLHALAQAIHPDIFGSLEGDSGRKIDLISSTPSKLM